MRLKSMGGGRMMCTKNLEELVAVGSWGWCWGVKSGQKGGGEGVG